MTPWRWRPDEPASNSLNRPLISIFLTPIIYILSSIAIYTLPYVGLSHGKLISVVSYGGGDYLAFAGPDDVLELAAVARAELPSMTALVTLRVRRQVGDTSSRQFTPFGDWTCAMVSVVWSYTDSRATRVSDPNR
jgi:hypothetical protein